MSDDFPAPFDRILRDAYARCTGAERVWIAFSMFDTEKALVEAALPLGVGEVERKRRICAHFYGDDLANEVFPK